MGMGLLAAGALSGLGQGIGQVSDTVLKNELAREERDWLLQRQEAMEIAKEGRAYDQKEKLRTDAVGRFQKAKDGLLSTAINTKYAESDAAVADAAASKTSEELRPDQLAVIEQSKGIDKAKLGNDPMLNIRAEYEAGDLSGKDYGKIVMDERRADRADLSAGQKASMDQLKYELDQRKVDIRDKQVMAMIGKIASAGGGGGDGKLPADAAMVEYLVNNGIAKDKTAAYTMVKEGKRIADSYSQTEKTDPVTNETTVTTTKKSAGGPDSKSTTKPSLDALFPIKK